MKSIESSPFMLPEQVESSRSGKVSSDALLEYLIPSLTWEAREQDFSPTLDLQLFTPYFQELYAHEKTGLIFNAEVREKFREIPSADKSTVIKSLTSKKAKVERGRTFYHDPFTNGLHASEIVDGEYQNMEHNIFSLMDQEYRPFLFAHTHPHDSLFSQQDYSTMLVAGYTNRTPILKGEVVLCPHIQMLALATKDTPQMSDEQLSSYFDYWQRRIDSEDSKKIETQKSRITLPFDAIEKFYINESKKQLEALEDFSRTTQEGTSQEAFTAFKDEADTQFQNKVNAYVERVLGIQGKIIDRAFSLERRATNRVLIDLARSLHVKLYFATDMQHFKEFSA